jgi:hypothetical protein
VCPEEDEAKHLTISELHKKVRKALKFPRNVEPNIVAQTRELQNQLPLYLQNELDEEDDAIPY